MCLSFPGALKFPPKGIIYLEDTVFFRRIWIGSQSSAQRPSRSVLESNLEAASNIRMTVFYSPQNLQQVECCHLTRPASRFLAFYRSSKRKIAPNRMPWVVHTAKIIQDAPAVIILLAHPD